MSLARLTANPIPQSTVDEMVGKLLFEFRTLPGIESIILFGSAARGTMTESSDLDLLLIFDAPEQARSGFREAQTRRKKMVWPLDLLCVDVSIFKERSAIGGVLFCARTEGKILFKRTA